MPGYAQYQKMSAQLDGAVRLGADQRHLERRQLRLRLRVRRQALPLRRRDRAAPANSVPRPTQAPAGRGGRGGGRGGTGIERGRQAASADAPDGKLKAFYRDRNLWVSDVSGGNESAITTDGNDKDRIKYGTASWVYGEELAQTSAIWWSPDSRKVAYYRFDEKQVLDYNLQLDQTKIQSVERRRGLSEGRRRRIRSSISSSTTSPRRRARRSTSATASPSTTPSSATTSIAWPGRPDGTRAAVQPHQPPAERPRVRWPPTPTPARRASSSTRSGRPAGSRTVRRCSSSRTTAASSGSRSATALPTSISTISPASSSRR